MAQVVVKGQYWQLTLWNRGHRHCRSRHRPYACSGCAWCNAGRRRTTDDRCCTCTWPRPRPSLQPCDDWQTDRDKKRICQNRFYLIFAKANWNFLWNLKFEIVLKWCLSLLQMVTKKVMQKVKYSLIFIFRKLHIGDEMGFTYLFRMNHLLAIHAFDNGLQKNEIKYVFNRF